MKNYLTVNEVSKKLKCSIPTIYRYVANRTIPHIKQGHRVLFIESDVEQWLMAQRVPAITETETS